MDHFVQNAKEQLISQIYSVTLLGLKTQLKDMVNNIRGSKTLTDHLISNDRVDEIVIGTEDDVSIFHQPSTSKVGARLQGLC